MTKQVINVGTAANDKKGDSLRAAFQKVNTNFTELYTALGLTDTTLNIGNFVFTDNTISLTNSNGDDSTATRIEIAQPVRVESDLTVGGDILPNAANGGNLGSASSPWHSLYVSNSTIYIGGVPLSLNESGNLLVDGNLIQGGGSNVTTSDTAPVSPEEGDLWYDTVSGRTYIQYDSNWVDASPVDGTGDPDRLVNGAHSVSLGSTGTLTLPDGLTISDSVISRRLEQLGEGTLDAIGSKLTLTDNSITIEAYADPDGLNNIAYGRVTAGGGQVVLTGAIEDVGGETSTIVTVGGGFTVVSTDGVVTSVFGVDAGGLVLLSNNHYIEPLSNDLKIASNGDAIISSNSTDLETTRSWTFDKSGTITTPLMLPATFTAVLDNDHMIGGPTLTGDLWQFTVAFVVGIGGAVETQIDNPVWPSNPGYELGQEFAYTEADHGIPGFNFYIRILDVVDTGPTGWAAEIGVTPAPEYPSTVASSGAIKLSANDSDWVFDPNGSLHYPDGSFSSTAFVGDATRLYGNVDEDVEVTVRHRPTVSAECSIANGDEFVADIEFDDDITVVQVGWQINTGSPSAPIWVTVTAIDPAPPANQYRITVADFTFVQGETYTFTDPDATVQSWTFNNETATLIAPGGAILSSETAVVGEGDVYRDFSIELLNQVGDNEYRWTFDNTVGALTVPGVITRPENETLILVTTGTTGTASVSVDGEAGRLILRTDNNVNTNSWIFGANGSTSFPDNKLYTHNDFLIQVTDGIPTGSVTKIYDNASWDETSVGTNLATTGGSGTGLTVDVEDTGSFYAGISISTAGTGYTDGDVITVTNGTGIATFTISVPSPYWTFGTDGTLITPGGITYANGASFNGVGLETALLEINVDDGTNAAVFSFNADSTFATSGPVVFPNTSEIRPSSTAYDTALAGWEYIRGGEIQGAVDAELVTEDGWPMVNWHPTNLTAQGYIDFLDAAWTEQQQPDPVLLITPPISNAFYNAMRASLVTIRDAVIDAGVSIAAGYSNTWHFSDDGSLTLPYNAVIQTTTGNISINADNYVYIDTTDSGQIEIGRNSTGGVVILGQKATTANVFADGDLFVEAGVYERFSSLADATGVVTHNCANGHIFYHTSPDANWTVNLTNFNGVVGRATSVTLIITQGGTGYYPSALQIGGTAQTINWQGNTTPTPSTSRTDVVTFSIICTATDTYTVLGQLTGF